MTAVPDSSPAESNESSPRYAGWRVVLVCFVMATLCWGFGFYGHGFYLAELQRLHGWSASLISSASTTYYLCSALLVVFVNDVIRRVGAPACVLTGTLALAGSAALLPFVTEPWHLFAVYLVMALGWATLSLGAITNILGLWFHAKRGLAISLALNGASFGGIVIVPGLVFLSAAAGFTTAMLTGAGLILALLLPLALFVLSTGGPQLPTAAAAAPTTADAIAPAWTRGLALRSPRFWSVSGAFSLGIMAQAGFLVHQIAFLEPTIGRSQAGIAVAITTTMAMLGRIILGAFIDRTDQRLLSALSLVSQCAALALMTQTTDATLLYTACAVYGFSVGNIITFSSLIIQREFEAASFGLLIGLSTAINQFTYAFGPGLVGLVRDATGGYGAPLALCIALNLTAAAIVLLRPKR